MKFFATLFITLFLSFTASASCYVSGYFKSNGTFVNGHYRTCPNNTITDNYSYFSNVNPWTGKIGNRLF